MWQQVSPSKGHQDETGIWFEPESQAIYEKAREREQQEGRKGTGPEADSDEASLEVAAAAETPEGTLLTTHAESDEVVGRQVPDASSARRAEAGISFGDMYQTLWLERHEGLDDLAIRAQHFGPTRRAEPSFTAEELVTAWCEVRGITPKHLTPADRVRVRSLLVTRFGCQQRQEVTASDRK